MKIFGRNWYLYLAPEEGGEGGVAAAPPVPPADPVEPTPVTYTQAEVDGREARARRAHERKLRELEAEFKKKIDALEAKVNAAPAPTPIDPTEEGKVEILQRRHERTIQELNERIAAQEAAVEAERQKRMDLQRDKLLDDALSNAGVASKNLKAARRFFLPDIVFDELDAKWMFQSPSGSLSDIEDAVQEYLPDSLKPSKIARGGAGTQGGIPARAARAQRSLDEAKQALAQMKADCAKRPNDNGLLTKFTRQKQLVQQLESDLKSATK